MGKRGRRNIISKNISKINGTYKSTNKSTSGITLIALVVTIIILIILASISIAILLGENGLLEKAKQGKSDYISARDAELAQMDNASDEIETLTKPDPTPGELEQIGEDTYEINSIEDLVALAYSVNMKEEKYLGKTIELGRSLDFAKDTSYVNPQAKYRLEHYEDEFCEGVKTGLGYVKDEENGISLKEQLTGENGFVPIGEMDGFYGTFNGNNNVISNINVKPISVFGGLIGRISYEKRLDINNLGLKGGNIEAIMYAGGIVGDNIYGEIHITNCYNTGNVTATTARAGGIMGNQSGTGNMTNCYNTGTIKSPNFTGGLIGRVDGAGKLNITDCYNTGTVESIVDTQSEFDGNKIIGGILGNNDGEVNITSCYNMGNLNAKDMDFECVGGILGQIGGKVTNINNCYNVGAITANVINSKYGNGGMGRVGGIVGQSCGSGKETIINCYNAGTINVTTLSNSMAGGIIGYNMYANVTNCYNTGTVKIKLEGTATGEKYQIYEGGIIGWLLETATPTNTYYLSGTAEKGIGIVQLGADVQTGTTVKTLAQMKSPSFLTEIKGTTGATAWKQANGEIPVLSWQK